jgi:hypothetical protein
MKNYSIVRIGHEYVVQAGAASILKVSSRREAAKLVTDAAELLEQEPAESATEGASIGCDSRDIPDPPASYLIAPGDVPDPAAELP